MENTQLETKRFCACGCGRIVIQKHSWYTPKYIHNHHTKGKRGPSCKRWRGGRKIHTSGYTYILSPNHPRATKDGYVLEHILIYEQYYKVCILPGGVVHHKNRIRNDNRLENLELLSTNQHAKHHHKGRLTDMDGRKCVICGSDKTRLLKSGRPTWRRNKNGQMLCARCHLREWWREKYGKRS
jgi:hypothetical protein